jgi:hypothetical protein
MRKKTKKHVLWASRDPNRTYVNIWRKQPTPSPYICGRWDGSAHNYLTSECVRDFQRYTGIKMPKGTLKKIRIVEVK